MTSSRVDDTRPGRPSSGNCSSLSTAVKILALALAAARGLSSEMNEICSSRLRSAVRSHLTCIFGVESPFGKKCLDFRFRRELACICFGDRFLDVLDFDEGFEGALHDPRSWPIERVSNRVQLGLKPARHPNSYLDRFRHDPLTMLGPHRLAQGSTDPGSSILLARLPTADRRPFLARSCLARG